MSTFQKKKKTLVCTSDLILPTSSRASLALNSVGSPGSCAPRGYILTADPEKSIIAAWFHLAPENYASITICLLWKANFLVKKVI
jgi:hypothetical protein